MPSQLTLFEPSANAALTPLGLAGLVILATLLYGAFHYAYLLFWHPLSRYPGPRLAAVSELWWAWAFTSGRWPFIIADLHRKYGDVVRVGPTQLSFSSVNAFQDIHGHYPGRGKGQFLKTDFYDQGQPVETSFGVRDPVAHAQRRARLNPAFSARALRSQESVIHQYVDQFVEKLGLWGHNGTSPINMTDVYNWVFFDIIGDLVFGEPYGAVAAGRPHPLIEFVLDAGYWSLLNNLRKRVPVVNLALPFIMPVGATRERFLTYRRETLKKARRRIARADNDNGVAAQRDDFFAHMLRKHGVSAASEVSEHSITEGELAVEGSVLSAAGSETSATCMTALTYYLLSEDKRRRWQARRGGCGNDNNKSYLATLQDEVRSSFPTNSSDITADSTVRLPYLNAVIEEALRLLPPGAFGTPRTFHQPQQMYPAASASATMPNGDVVPPAFQQREAPSTVDGHHVPAGTTVWHASYAMTRDPRYWRDPEAFRPERWLFANGNGGSAHGDGNGNGNGTSSGSGFVGSAGTTGGGSSSAGTETEAAAAAAYYYSTDDRRATAPFLAGTRRCIGAALAHAEMRVLLAKMVWAWDMELDNKSTTTPTSSSSSAASGVKGGRQVDGDADADDDCDEEIETEKEWNEKCRMYLLWRKPDVRVRFRPRGTVAATVGGDTQVCM